MGSDGRLNAWSERDPEKRPREVGQSREYFEFH
jgi:hypothetical protein